MASPITTTEEIPEGATPTLTATVQDEDGVAIPGSALDAITLSLVLSGVTPVTYINNRVSVDLSSSVDTAGRLSFRLASADTTHVAPGLTTEYHDAIIRWDYDTDGHGVAIVRMPIVDIPSIP